MTTNGVSPTKAFFAHYSDPENLYLGISTAAAWFGKGVQIWGKESVNFAKYANLAKIGGVFNDFFAFWDAGQVVKSVYAGGLDLWTVVVNHHIQGNSAEEIREKINEDVSKQVSLNRWGVERVITAALSTFTASVLVYACLNKIGAIKSAPSAKLCAMGSLSAAVGNVYNYIEQNRKIEDGPVKSKVKPEHLAKYTKLHKASCEYDKYMNITFLCIRFVSIGSALSLIYGKGNTLGNLLGKVNAWSGDLCMVGYTIYAGQNLTKAIVTGEEMKLLESEKAKKDK